MSRASADVRPFAKTAADVHLTNPSAGTPQCSNNNSTILCCLNRSTIKGSTRRTGAVFDVGRVVAGEDVEEEEEEEKVEKVEEVEEAEEVEERDDERDRSSCCRTV